MSVQKRNRDGARKTDKAAKVAAPVTSMAWVGSKTLSKTRLNSLTGSGNFNPKVPVDQPGDEGDDALIWADVPEKLSERLASKPQQITESCLLENAKAILRLYENDVIQHVVKQQL